MTAEAASDDSLDQLDAALATAAQLTSRADAVVDAFVARARRDGRSWTEIGVRMGVSKQAARKRFGELDLPAPVLPAGVPARGRAQGTRRLSGSSPSATFNGHTSRLDLEPGWPASPRVPTGAGAAPALP